MSSDDSAHHSLSTPVRIVHVCVCVCIVCSFRPKDVIRFSNVYASVFRGERECYQQSFGVFLWGPVKKIVYGLSRQKTL